MQIANFPITIPSMTKQWRQAAERAEQLLRIAEEQETKNPPITRMSPEEADSSRTITESENKECVRCNLPCFGVYVPKEYNHRGIFKDPEKHGGTCCGITCELTNMKVCLTNPNLPERR